MSTKPSIGDLITKLVCYSFKHWFLVVNSLNYSYKLHWLFLGRHVRPVWRLCFRFFDPRDLHNLLWPRWLPVLRPEEWWAVLVFWRRSREQRSRRPMVRRAMHRKHSATLWRTRSLQRVRSIGNVQFFFRNNYANEHIRVWEDNCQDFQLHWRFKHARLWRGLCIYHWEHVGVVSLSLTRTAYCVWSCPVRRIRWSANEVDFIGCKLPCLMFWFLKFLLVVFFPLLSSLSFSFFCFLLFFNVSMTRNVHYHTNQGY